MEIQSLWLFPGSLFADPNEVKEMVQVGRGLGAGSARPEFMEVLGQLEQVHLGR
jgi:hypothetical protein